MPDIIPEDRVLDQDSLAKVEMPNRGGFTLPDPRPDTPSAKDGAGTCMRDCPVDGRILGTAKRLDVTPETVQTD